MSGIWDTDVYNDALMCEKLVNNMGAVVLDSSRPRATKPAVGFNGEPRFPRVETHTPRARSRVETTRKIAAQVARPGGPESRY